MATHDPRPSQLFYGDNLEVLRQSVGSETVDLVYLDPPFNSARVYSVSFASAGDASAQIQAFDDTWQWTNATQQQYDDYVNGGGLPPLVAEALAAMRTLLKETPLTAYMVNMAPRLVELHRVLKPTGSLYIHCDTTASHYLKVMLDAIFTPERFRAEIIWKRYGSHNDAANFGRVHDVLLYYTKGKTWTFNREFQAYDDLYVEQRFRFADADGRRYAEQNLVSPQPRPNLTYPYTASNGITYAAPPNGWKVEPGRMAQLDAQNRLHYPAKANGRLRLKSYLDEGKGIPISDIWTDIGAIGGTAPERLGYPTQKPVALLERILRISSNPGDMVLDPFCGCGTALDAAVTLERSFIGIDITYLAVDLIRNRLRDRHGSGVDELYEVRGIPRDLAGAHALFDASPFDFERYAVSLVRGTPNQKQVGDRGRDGIIRLYRGRKEKAGQAVVSVKGGKQLNPGMVRDLGGTVASDDKLDMGVFVCLYTPSPGMVKAATEAGQFIDPVGNAYPRVQIITVEELLAGKNPKLPPVIPPYTQAARAPEEYEETPLF